MERLACYGYISKDNVQPRDEPDAGQYVPLYHIETVNSHTDSIADFCDFSLLSYSAERSRHRRAVEIQPFLHYPSSLQTLSHHRPVGILIPAFLGHAIVCRGDEYGNA